VVREGVDSFGIRGGETLFYEAVRDANSEGGAANGHSLIDARDVYDEWVRDEALGGEVLERRVALAKRVKAARHRMVWIRSGCSGVRIIGI